MKLFGKEVSSNQLDKIRREATGEELEAINSYLYVQEKLKAKRLMEKEKDPIRKAEMKELYMMGQYNFEYIFGLKNK